MTTDERTVKVFRVYIRATPERIWEAITDPAWNDKYGYRAPSYYDLRPGGSFQTLPSDEMKAYGAPDVMIDGEMLVVEPPHRLVQKYRFLFSPEHEAEGFTQLTYDIVEENDGICRLTVTHDVTDAPIHGATVVSDTPLHEGGGGWAWILSDLKTLLESGDAMS